jgi:hypothetical protein
MTGYENPDTIKRRNARRRDQLSAMGSLWKKNNPERARENDRMYRERHNYAQLIDEQRQPISIKLESFVCTSDYHVPFVQGPLLDEMYKIAEDQGIGDLVIAGDFFDCDNYSKYTHLGYSESFLGEIEEARAMFEELLSVFDHIYMCRGNHEKRFIDLNAGKIGMQELVRLAVPDTLSKSEFDQRVRVTTDDFMDVEYKGAKWKICHPRSFRIIPLSVAKDLASKHLCNVATGHGHNFAQGRDRSGRFRVLELGGLFDPKALDYLRESSCHPMIRSGFYVFGEDGDILPVEGVGP